MNSTIGTILGPPPLIPIRVNVMVWEPSSQEPLIAQPSRPGLSPGFGQMTYGALLESL